MKKDFIEVTPDGKREIEEGKEPLNKQPVGEKPFSIDAAQSNYQDATNEEEEKKKKKKKVKKSLSEIWDLIKKDLKHQEAFMDIGDDEDEEENIEEAPEEAEQGAELSDEEHGHLEELLGGEGSEEDTGQDSEEEGEVPEDVVEAAGGEEEVEEMSDEELEKLMEQLGHSPQEIAFVLHNHAPPAEDQEAQEKMRRDQEMHAIDIDGKRQDHKIKDAEAGISSGNAQKMGDMDVKHKEKMNELEYDMARREKEIELKYKEKELEMKMNQSEDHAKHDISNAKKDANQKRDHKDAQHEKKLKEPTPKPAAKK